MNELIDLIQEDEGLRLEVYDDVTGKPIRSGTLVIGNPTIGYGRLLTSERGITKAEADMLFDRDLRESIEELDRKYPWFSGLDSVRADVVVSMVYNMGLPTFSKFKNTIAAIEAGDYKEAAAEIMDSRAARQLPNRYGRLSRMMFSGERK